MRVKQVLFNPSLALALLFTLTACAPGEDWPDDSQSPPAQAGSPPSAPGHPTVQAFAIGTDADHPPLLNADGGASGAVRDTAITVLAGDRLEIRPSALIREEKKVLPPTISKTDHTVCTQTAEVCIGTVPIVQHQCHDECHVCVQCVPLTPVCSPWRCCDTVCQDVHTGDRCILYRPECVKTEDQWTQVITFPGLGPSEPFNDTNPMASSDLTTSGLKLRFSFLDAGGNPRDRDRAVR